MRDIDQVLHVTCCACGDLMTAQVRCSGKGLAAGPHAVGAVKLVCPLCDSTNQVYFEMCGRLRAVELYLGPCEALVPSVT
jgi:hypothetical protein